MADNEDHQWRVVVYDEPRPGPLRAERCYYFGATDAEFVELQDVAPLGFHVIVYREWRAPIRAARNYYVAAESSVQDYTDASFDYVISAYQDSWRLAPAMARLLFSPAEDGTSVPLEMPVDDSCVVGRYQPGRARIARGLLYTNVASDADAPAVEAENHSTVVGMRFVATKYRPLPFHRFIQYGDEGIAPDIDCAPRDRGPGVPTAVGLERYTDGTTCSAEHDERHVHDETCGGGR